MTPPYLTYLLGTLFSILVVAYVFIIFSFSETLLTKPRLNKIFRIPASILNTGILVICMSFSSTNSPILYLIILTVFTLEFNIFYRERIANTYFLASVYLIHIMCIRSIVVSVYSAITNIPIYNITSEGLSLYITTAITLLLLCISTKILKITISAPSLKMVANHKESFLFLILWITILNISFILMSNVYNVDNDHSYINSMILIFSITTLIAFYIVLFFSIKTSSLLAYKKRNSELEIDIQNEQQYRDSIIKDSLMTYQFNLTKNIFIQNFEQYKNTNNPDNINSYSDVMIFLSQEVVYFEDLAEFINFTTPCNLIKEFEMGRAESFLEYRRMMPDNKYVWVKAVITLVKDVFTGDIKGLMYIKDIDSEKKKQNELIFKAERDSLTGLYNKGMTSKLISDTFIEPKNRSSTHALLIIDIDNFKIINDTLGHTYGDAVLCELSSKLSKIFRDDDIVGRIGGDEFIAFMKNIKNISIVEAKAEEVCRSFKNTYHEGKSAGCTISGSIGVAISPMHGNSFDVLYRNADAALYTSKNKGKDVYTLYEGGTFSGYSSNRTKIDAVRTTPQKNFKDNRIDYVFTMLFEAPDTLTAIKSVLELLTLHFNFSRGYIFEISKDRKYIVNTHEWCEEGIEPQLDTMKKIPTVDVSDLLEKLTISGTSVISDLSILSTKTKNILNPHGILSMVNFGMFDKDELFGLIGFDNCVELHNQTEQDIYDISDICNVLATFILKQNAIQKAENNSSSLNAIMDNMDSFSYVVDEDTFEILFLNRKTKLLSPDFKEGGHCYSSLRKKTAPCSDCPIPKLRSNAPNESVHAEIYNETFNIWTKTTASYINWIDGKHACLLSCYDISMYKGKI